ncbi:Integral membrane family protein [Mycena indigotica]|uniref:Integral membrane family protein n=1 Tax=Mycena indigotica TaxID=2126181 RepID=A0A8H6W1B3_9AGAR|nr:Integral membrane family protein [Mycena indigotica]KAF7301889.1 Integral membrane family protein [Mycena indigotica]
MPPSLVSLLLPTLLAAHGLRKKSLSQSGAITAFVVGFLMISGSTGKPGVDLGLKVWGASLIGFYLIGSRATKYGKAKKRKLEQGYSDYGNRSGWQVLSNSFSAVVACSVWNALFVHHSVHSQLLSSLGIASMGPSYSTEWCPLSRDISDGRSRVLLFAALGHFACCLGDTLASELGILSSSPPRLVTTGKVVPPGTNGGVSVGGTLASLVGGATMGIIMSVSLILENSSCRSDWLSTSRDLVLWGALGGIAGSALDSLLGATIQMTRYDEEKKLIVEDRFEGSQLKVLNGLNILTNNQVNVVSSIASALVVGLFA